MPDWTTFLIYIVATAVTPGPNNLLSLAEGAQRGFVRALPVNAGIFCGFLIVMLLCTALTASLNRIIPAIMTPMRFVGAAYLLWLAWGTFVSKPSTAEGRKTNARSENRKAFFRGFLLQFVNVKIIIYGIMSMQVFILPYYDEPVILCGFAALLAANGASLTLLWSGFGSSLNGLFRHHAKAVNTVLALLLVYCAVAIFF